MLAYCAFVVVDAWTFQKEQENQFEQLLANRTLANLPPPAISGRIGRLDIPRLGISVVVIEGTSASR
jgi:sortase (surface protein transpeptidase)